PLDLFREPATPPLLARSSTMAWRPTGHGLASSRGFAVWLRAISPRPEALSRHFPASVAQQSDQHLTGAAWLPASLQPSHEREEFHGRESRNQRIRADRAQYPARDRRKWPQGHSGRRHQRSRPRRDQRSSHAL